MREISFYIHYNTPYPHLPLVQRTPDTWERFSRVFRDATWGGKESPLILNIISRNQRLEIRICILDARSRIILQNRMRCNCCSYSRVLDGSENCTSEIFFFLGGGKLVRAQHPQNGCHTFTIGIRRQLYRPFRQQYWLNVNLQWHLLFHMKIFHFFLQPGAYIIL